jgi:hypothetical protein
MKLYLPRNWFRPSIIDRRALLLASVEPPRTDRRRVMDRMVAKCLLVAASVLNPAFE